jgi:alginate O-acetyltransferase complex protein AlgI
MEFNSVIYVIFLATAVALYYVVPRSYTTQRLIVLTASALFYAFWSLPFLLHLVGVLLFNYALTLRMVKSRDVRARRRLLVIGIVADLGNLFVFKYAGLAVQTGNALVSALGWRDLLLPDITPLLPLAISFYTFSVISYLVDVYRDPRGRARDAQEFVFYATFFPHLIAGPILRKDEFFPQCGYQAPKASNLTAGVHRIIAGLFQKAVIADNLAVIVDHGYRNYAALSTSEAAVVLVAYSFQIFFDFAGYSAIAIGSARLFGYVFPENFNTPYAAVSLSDFWRRWHMTLSRWIRDYIYIPLGGSRNGQLSTNINLVTTMALAGLWHGASWTFAVWGLWHGVGLALQNLYSASGLRRRLGTLPDLVYKPVSIALTFAFVTFGWVLFRAPDFATAAAMYGKFIPGSALDWSLNQAYLLKSYGFTALVLYTAIVVLSRSQTLKAAVFDVPRRRVLMYAITLGLVVILPPLQTDPFIYFRF